MAACWDSRKAQDIVQHAAKLEYDPDVLARESMEDLQAALEQFAAIAEDAKK